MSSHPASNTSPQREPSDAIVGVVIDLLLAGGYESVELRTVARQAKVSLATIYKHFPSRDALLFAAVERWMDDEVYRPLPGPDPDASTAENLVMLLDRIFEPWMQNPLMAEAWMRVRLRPGGAELFTQGAVAVAPVMLACFADADRPKVDDVMMVLDNVSFATMSRFAQGVLAFEDVLPTLERTVHLLVDD